MNNLKVYLVVFVGVLTVAILMSYMYRSPISWDYKLCNINGNDALFFYNPNICFLFQDRHERLGELSRGDFRVSGFAFQWFTESETEQAIFSYSPITRRATWKIGKHEIVITDSGRAIAIDGQSIKYDNDTIVVVNVHSDFKHELVFYPTTVAALDEREPALDDDDTLRLIIEEFERRRLSL